MGISIKVQMQMQFFSLVHRTTQNLPNASKMQMQMQNLTTYEPVPGMYNLLDCSMIAASAAPTTGEAAARPSTRRTPPPITRSRARRSPGNPSTPPRPGEQPPRPAPGTCSPGAARPALPTLVGSSSEYITLIIYYIYASIIRVREGIMISY